MKRQYLIFFTLLFSFFTQIVSGQKPCNNFDCAYKKAENFLKQAAYQKALDNLDSAEGYLTDTNTKEKEQIKQLRRRLFVAIEKEKVKAQKATKEAKRQTQIAKKALAQVEIEKQTAIAAEKKTKAILDKIYFYDDKFGLAYDKKTNKYGFIDKNLNIKIQFIYDEALPFDVNGYARLKSSNLSSKIDWSTDKYTFDDESYILIDTFGNKYKLSTDTSQLDSSVTALDLRFKNFETIPNSVLQNKNLKILYLSYNKISKIPNSISELNKLQFLDLSNNLGGLFRSNKDLERNKESKSPTLHVLEISKDKNEDPISLSKLDSLIKEAHFEKITIDRVHIDEDKTSTSDESRYSVNILKNLNYLLL